MQNLTAHRNEFRYEVAVPNSKETDPNKREVTRVEVSYMNGSRNKGVLVSIRNITIEQVPGEGHHFETFALLDGISIWAKILPRKNMKQVAIVAEQLDSAVPAIALMFQTNRDEVRQALISLTTPVAQ